MINTIAVDQLNIILSSFSVTSTMQLTNVCYNLFAVYINFVLFIICMSVGRIRDEHIDVTFV
jgi:hypothetical protein